MFKVGQRVVCILFGKGEVKAINEDNRVYSVTVRFDHDLQSYTLDGRYKHLGKRALYPEGTEFIVKEPEPVFFGGQPVWAWDDIKLNPLLRMYSYKTEEGVHMVHESFLLASWCADNCAPVEFDEEGRVIPLDLENLK